MDKTEKIIRIAEIVIEVGPEVVQGVIDLVKKGEITAEDIRAMKENSRSPREILAGHGITLDD